ncbi:MAG: hypothetical protein IID46_09730 [Planctomycetes bacterium]|nr:hypothetical protein [Planctomycetota bacterium]
MSWGLRSEDSASTPATPCHFEKLTSPADHSVVHKSKTVLVFINQLRHKIGGFAFSNKETTSGGNALKFYSSIRIDVRRIGSLKKNDIHFGNRVRVKIVKNKMAPPFKSVELDLLFNEGISKELDLLDAALFYKVIQQSGSWFSFEGKKIAQGREQALNFLKTEKEVASSIFTKVHEVISLDKGGGS